MAKVATALKLIENTNKADVPAKQLAMFLMGNLRIDQCCPETQQIISDLELELKKGDWPCETPTVREYFAALIGMVDSDLAKLIIARPDPIREMLEVAIHHSKCWVTASATSVDETLEPFRKMADTRVSPDSVFGEYGLLRGWLRSLW